MATAANELSPVFSPDGRWIAYVSDESGIPEVYVQPFPGPGGKVQVSNEGGSEPRWARRGRELFYRHGREMMTVAFESTSTFVPKAPGKLFEGDFTEGHRGHPNYDVSADGQRFLMIRDEHTVRSIPVRVQMDITAELNRIAPRRR